MTRCKWNLRRSAAVVLVLAIGSGYWGLAGGCAPAGGGDGNGTKEIVTSEATCDPLDDQAGGFDINLRAVSSQGRQLAYTSRVITSPQDGSLQVETEVTADGQLVMSVTATVDSNGGEVQIEYGPLVPGVSSASAVLEDGVVSGMVDGRALVSMPVDQVDTNNMSFQDGDPPTELGMDPDLKAAVTELFEAAATTAEGCSAPNGNDVAKATTVKGQKKSGHYSETVETGDCAECWAKCIGEGTACAGAVTGTCWLTLIGAPACYLAGYAACIYVEIDCDIDCYRNGGGCCPVMCHDNYPASVCCLDGESCMDPDTGRCCGPGEKPCGGKYCCEGTEECINDIVQGGVECCEPQNICGDYLKTCCDPTDSCITDLHLCCPAGHPPCTDKCCDSGQQCINNDLVCCDVGNICNDRCCADEEDCHAGVCCKPENKCGSVCCDDLASGCIPELSLCCGFDQDACGNTCCPIGESCVGGTACCPDARICGDVCCDEGHGCDPQTDLCTPCPNPTDTPCLVGGCCPVGKVCSDKEGLCCDPGEIYCCKGPGGCGCKLPHLCVN